MVLLIPPPADSGEEWNTITNIDYCFPRINGAKAMY